MKKEIKKETDMEFWKRINSFMKDNGVSGFLHSYEHGNVTMFQDKESKLATLDAMKTEKIYLDELRKRTVGHWLMMEERAKNDNNKERESYFG